MLLYAGKEAKDMSKDTYIGIIQDQRRSLYELMEEAVVPRRPMERIELSTTKNYGTSSRTT